MNDDEVEPSRLLARKRGPSILEKEEMFDAIAARVIAEARPPQKGRARWMLGLSAAALLGGVVLAIRVRDPGEGVGPTGGASGEEFVARGPSAPVIELRCTPAPCARGSRMRLRVTPPPGQPNVALFARSSDGIILWYLPPPGERMSAPPRAEWLPDAVVLNDEHRPGKYTLYAAFSSDPLDRDALKAELAQGLRSTSNVTVLERSLVVEAAP